MNAMKWEKLPFNPARFPVFYGFVIIVVGAIGVLTSAPGQTIGVSVFRNYLETDLQMPKTALSLAYTLGTLISGFLAVVSGRLYDKHGARVLAPIAGIFMGLSLLYLSHTPVLFHWLNLHRDAFWPLAVKVAMLVLGFFTLRFFGQGMLTLVCRNMVMKWFNNYRGMANAFLGLFLVFGFNAAPGFFQRLIDAYTWEVAWRYIALFAMVGFSVFAWILFRDNPEKFGIKPDGPLKPKKFTNKVEPNITHHYTLKESLKSYAFWVFNLILSINTLFVTAATFYIKDIFLQAGYDAQKAISVFVPSAFVGAVFHVIGSWASDRTKLKYFASLLATGILFTTTGMLFLERWHFMYYFIITGLGVATGNFSIVSTIAWPRFFGTKHLGAISGYNMSWMVVGSALGPLFFSLFNDFFGNFKWPIAICAGITFVLLLASFKADNKQQ